MRKSSFVIGLLCAFLVFSAGAAQAEEEEELAPGFKACMEKAGGVTPNITACQEEALEYWDKQLNINYKQQMEATKDALRPEARKAALLKAERAWIAYRDAMADFVGDWREGGTLARVIGMSFLLQTTKMQAKFLQP